MAHDKSALTAGYMVFGLLLTLNAPADAQPVFSIEHTANLVAQNDLPWDYEDCIFRSSNACITMPDGGNTMGQAYCLDQERAYWDGRLNQYYQDLRTVYAEDIPERYIINRADALQQMQRDWIAYRHSLCAFSYAQYGYGSMRNTAHAVCYLQETARQAIILKRELEYFQNR